MHETADSCPECNAPFDHNMKGGNFFKVSPSSQQLKHALEKIPVGDAKVKD